jgi:hypothetical protein
MNELRFRCSPEQEEVIADHLLLGHELGMQPDERAWILAQVRKVYPDGRVVSADLDLAYAEWVVQVQV